MINFQEQDLNALIRPDFIFSPYESIVNQYNKKKLSDVKKGDIILNDENIPCLVIQVLTAPRYGDIYRIFITYINIIEKNINQFTGSSEQLIMIPNVGKKEFDVNSRLNIFSNFV